jgi:hypothetical protein
MEKRKIPASTRTQMLVVQPVVSYYTKLPSYTNMVRCVPSLYNMHSLLAKYKAIHPTSVCIPSEVNVVGGSDNLHMLCNVLSLKEFVKFILFKSNSLQKCILHSLFASRFYVL